MKTRKLIRDFKKGYLDYGTFANALRARHDTENRGVRGLIRDIKNPPKLEVEENESS